LPFLQFIDTITSSNKKKILRIKNC